MNLAAFGRRFNALSDDIKPFDYVGKNVHVASCVACAGDSTADINIFTSSGAQRKSSRGTLNWAQAFLGQPFDFRVDDDFSVSGSTTANLLAVQVPNIISKKLDGARQYSHCFISSGTNDHTVSSLSVSQTLENFKESFELLVSSGITPIAVSIRPRGVDASVQVFKQVAKSVNKGLEILARQGLCIFIDVSELYADNSTAFGNILPATSYDNLHPNAFGACLEGAEIARVLRAAGVIPDIKFATTQDDVFHRTLNPYGCIGSITAGAITANPLLQGGTTAPTGMATAGGTWSKTTRTLANGQTRSDPRVALAASATHTLTSDCIATGAFTSTQLQPGDIVEAVCLLKLGNGVTAAGLNRINLQVIANDGVSSFDYNDLQFDLSDTAALPVSGTEFIWLRSPRVTVPAWAGSGNHYIRTRLNLGTTAAGAGNVDVLGFECRPVSIAS